MKFAIAIVAATISAGAAQAQPGQCSARSGERTAALVELYTSEGCDSCPPADRWLSSLAGKGYARDRLVPIALHVDYWDYIGWKDPYARSAFAGRQRKMAALARASFVYTPQVLLQGKDFRGWGSGKFDEAVARINGEPARARIELSLDASRKGAFLVQARAAVPDPGLRAEAGFYLAAYENKLVSRVTAGENRGRTLEHDHVVLEWEGPISFGASPAVAEKRELPLLPGAVTRNSGVVAFVQDRRSGEILQALMLPACPG